MEAVPCAEMVKFAGTGGEATFYTLRLARAYTGREKIAKMNYRPAKRVPTRVPRSVKKRTLEEKARRSRIKRLRSKPSPDE